MAIFLYPPMLNIGLKIGDTGTLSREAAEHAVEALGVHIIHSAVHASDTEPTLVVVMDRALSPPEAHALSAALYQEAIAQYDGDQGELYGPGAEKWRPFNPDYFLLPDGMRLSAVGDEQSTR